MLRDALRRNHPRDRLRALTFLESQKANERLSPPISRARRRLWIALSGSQARADARARRDEWLNLARKLASRRANEQAVPQF
jgi:hypothetical protein